MDFFPIAKIFLHALPPERAHNLTITALKKGWVPILPVREYEQLHTSLWGLEFMNPVGLAAGFDKDAEVYNEMAHHGFGFVETGSVTPLPQPGNEEPRLFRLPSDQAVINRMGMNSKGGEAFCANLAGRTTKRVVGANLGKNKTSTDAVADYVTLLRSTYPLADYITLNISSPNTEGLRKMQEQKQLEELIKELFAVRESLIADIGVKKPILIKIAPDNTPEQLEDIARLSLEYQVDGLILTNTSVARPASLTGIARFEKGGLSGKPIFTLATETLRTMRRLTKGAIPLIGSGGISSGADAYAKIKAGASLLQLYSALVYQGLGLVQKIKDDLVESLARDGFKHISEAVGVEAR